MQEAQALAEIPLEETLVSESSDDDADSPGKHDDDYDEEEDKAEV